MEKIDIFAEFIQCVHPMYLWVYDADGNLLRTTTPQFSHIYQFLFDEHIETIKSFAIKHTRPSIITSGFHTMWLVDSSRENDELKNVYTLGPFYLDSYPEKAILEEFDKQYASLPSRYDLIENLRRLPVISSPKILEYTVMMHYAITGEQISLYDLHYQTGPTHDQTTSETQTKVHGTYEAEQEMLRMVREGDLRVIDHMKRMSTMANVGKLANDNSAPLRQLKNTIFVAITLFSRAAIEGGLYPETAMTLTDMYFQAVEAADSFQELTDITITMQSDFVNRVHKIKNDRYSKPIRNLVDYIDLHLEENILLETVAGEFGYSEYYLTKKFKKETGVTFKEYIRDRRLERAKEYLGDRSLSIFDISMKLKFTSQSYFIESFRKKFLMTPNEYRNTLK
ncbi:MAG: helix-turn-helix transcriptional regulator [Flexilinea sp.]|nr:helix-turn-helix transcriptional regulator [Flexilinea sp.]